MLVVVVALNGEEKVATVVVSLEIMEFRKQIVILLRQLVEQVELNHLVEHLQYLLLFIVEQVH